jgi:hypothetical protein
MKELDFSPDEPRDTPQTARSLIDPLVVAVFNQCKSNCSSSTALGQVADALYPSHDGTNLQLTPDVFHSVLARAEVMKSTNEAVDHFKEELAKVKMKAEIAISVSEVAIRTEDAAAKRIVSAVLYGKSTLFSNKMSGWSSSTNSTRCRSDAHGEVG